MPNYLEILSHSIYFWYDLSMPFWPILGILFILNTAKRYPSYMPVLTKREQGLELYEYRVKWGPSQ